MRHDRGFTLVELLVVVVVLAVITAIAIPAFAAARTRAQDSAARSDLRTAFTTALTARTTTGTWPDAATLTATEPSLRTTTGTATTGTISIATAGDRFAATARSASGTCHRVSADATGTPTWSQDREVCTAALVLAGGANLAALVLAVDANLMSTMAQDAAGTTAVSATGQRVCRWADSSAAGSHLVQATTTMCPTYGADAVGGFVNFATNGLVQTTVTLSPDATILVVAQSNTSVWNHHGWIASARGTNGFIIHPRQGNTGVVFYAGFVGAGWIDLGQRAPASITAPTLYTLTMSGSNPVTGRFGINGSTSVYSAAVARTSQSVLVTFGADGDLGRAGDGRYREILIFNRALTDSELTTVETHLRTKWGTG